MGYDLKWDGLSAADLVNKGLGGNQNVKKARARNFALIFTVNQICTNKYNQECTGTFKTRSEMMYVYI